MPGSDAASPRGKSGAEEQLEEARWTARKSPTTTCPMIFPTSPETRREQPSGQLPFDDFNEKVDYNIFTQEFDEEITAEELCDEAELDRLRAFLDKQTCPFARRCRALGKPLAAPA